MQKTTVLNSDQLWAIANSLRSAAGLYNELAKTVMLPPSNPILKDQFEKQTKEALEFAQILESADFAHVITED